MDMLKNTKQSYGLVSIIFHWAFFMLIIGTILVIGLAEDMPDGPEKFAQIGIHKSIGVLLLGLIFLRFIWRVNNERPEPLAKNPLEKKLAHLMHLLLYAILFAQPVFGILMSQSADYDVSFFGLVTLPALVAENELFGDIMHEAHHITGTLLVVLIVIHGLAAIKHHLFDKDRTLIRMLKGR